MVVESSVYVAIETNMFSILNETLEKYCFLKQKDSEMILLLVSSFHTPLVILLTLMGLMGTNLGIRNQEKNPFT